MGGGWNFRISSSVCGSAAFKEGSRGFLKTAGILSEPCEPCEGTLSEPCEEKRGPTKMLCAPPLL